MKQFKSLLLVNILFLTGLLVSGCVSSQGNYGKLVYDDMVKKDFESFRVDPQYNYYYYGTNTFPQAFMGLSKNIELVSSFWKPIDLTPEILHNWIWLHAKRKSGDVDRYGSQILEKGGKQIGIWYSLEGWQQWTTVETLGENQIRISSPIGGNDGRSKKL